MHVALEDELGLIVERGKRLIQQQNVRIGRERADQRHALAHAARELIRVRVLKAPKAVGFQQLVRPAAGFGGALAGDSKPSSAFCRTVRHSNKWSFCRRMPTRVGGAANARAVESDAAFGRPQQAGDQRQQRGLAAAARPDDAAKLAVADREVQVLERKRLSGSGQIRIGQAFAADPYRVRSLLDRLHEPFARRSR